MNPADTPTQPSTISVRARKDDPFTPFLVVLLGNGRVYQATDFILRPASEGHCVMRCRGRLRKAIRLKATVDGALFSDEEGLLTDAFSFEKIIEAIRNGDAERHLSTKVYRTRDMQVRVHIADDDEQGDRRIFVRIQPLLPPPLEDTLARANQTLQFLREASGLVVVCGPIGSGKSTLAASICNDWANTGRHIMTIEDPVEYRLNPATGIVTHREADFNHVTHPRGRSTLREAIPQALRGDIDGLYIGETRQASTLETCLEFAGAREPVITTFHAGSVTDCIVRLVTMASSAMPELVAKMTLAQCLHAIIYTNLAYGSDGRIHPVLMVLPCSDVRVRRAIAQCNPASIHSEIETLLSQRALGLAAISLDAAKNEALSSKCTPESVDLALPMKHERISAA